jgi:hypothetical protein
VLHHNVWYLDRRSIWRNLGLHIVGIVECSVEVQLGRLRLLIYIVGRESRVWRSQVTSSGPCDSNARGLWTKIVDWMTRVPLWQRVERPRLVVAKVLRKDREWRAWIMRQIMIIVQIDRELLEVVVVISI